MADVAVLDNFHMEDTDSEEEHFRECQQVQAQLKRVLAKRVKLYLSMIEPVVCVDYLTIRVASKKEYPAIFFTLEELDQMPLSLALLDVPRSERWR